MNDHYVNIIVLIVGFILGLITVNAGYFVF